MPAPPFSLWALQRSGQRTQQIVRGGRARGLLFCRALGDKVCTPKEKLCQTRKAPYHSETEWGMKLAIWLTSKPNMLKFDFFYRDQTCA